MWNLRNQVDEHRERETKMIATKREANHKRLKYREQTEGFWAGSWLGAGAKWAMGTKEGTCWDEHWELYVSDVSLGSTRETNTPLYVN